MTDTRTASAGVQELINRLREEGVQAGRQEADRVVQEARKQAAQIVAQAKEEAEEMRKKARADIESERTAAFWALHMAARDTQIRLREIVKSSFATRVKRLVSGELQHRDFLRQIILAIAGRAASQVKEGQPIEICVSEEYLRAPEEGGGLTEKGMEAMRHFVTGVTGELLREGVVIKPAEGKNPGICVRLVGEDLEIDLSDRAISDLLLKHLIPRYRTVLSGLE